MRDDPKWTLTDHVCRICFGRVLERTDGRQHFARCSHCGAEARGTHLALCACGTKIGGRDAGLRCAPNPDRSPDDPAEYIAVCKDDEAATPTKPHKDRAPRRSDGRLGADLFDGD